MKKQPVVPPHTHADSVELTIYQPHHVDHETGGDDAITALAAETITSGTLDGDRLPAISTTKKGAVPAVVPASPSEFLRDTGDFERVVQADVGGLEITATPQFAGLGIKTPGSDNKMDLIEGAQIGIATGPRLVFRDAAKLLEVLDGDVNIGNMAASPGTGGTWSVSHNFGTTSNTIRSMVVFLGKLYACGERNVWQYDGVNWTAVYTNSDYIFHALCVFAGKLYVAVQSVATHTDHTIIDVTANGTVWTNAYNHAEGATSYVHSLVAQSGYLYAGLFQYGVIKSADGTTWGSTGTGLVGGEYVSLVSFNGNIYKVSSNQCTVQVYNGISTWTTVYTAAGALYAAFVWNGELYIGGVNGKIYASSNGASWSQTGDLTTGNIYAFIEYNGKLLANASDKVYSSVDGTTWVLFYDAAETYVYSFCLSGGLLYLGSGYDGGGTGMVYVYTDVTLVTAPTLQSFGPVKVWGQFRPGDAAGILYNLFMSGGPGYGLWLKNGLSTDYLQGGSPPAFANLSNAIK
jgi:hypothetical protein